MQRKERKRGRNKTGGGNDERIKKDCKMER
jgi:hypothetical protein